MSPEPAIEVEASVAPATPRPAGVADLGRFRGRAGAAPAVVAPPRRSLEGDGPGAADRADSAQPAHSPLSAAVAVPVPVPDWSAPPPTTTRPAVEADGAEMVIRRVRRGSVLAMAFGLSLCTVVVVVGAGALIGLAVSSLGLVEDLGWTDVGLDGPLMLRAAGIGGGILVVAASVLSVVFAEFFNLLSTITGGLRVEVGPPSPSRGLGRRDRKAAKRAANDAKAEKGSDR